MVADEFRLQLTSAPGGLFFFRKQGTMPTRHFIIRGSHSVEDKLDHIEKKHGRIVRAVLFESPDGGLVYGATEFEPHEAEKEDPK